MSLNIKILIKRHKILLVQLCEAFLKELKIFI